MIAVTGANGLLGSYIVEKLVTDSIPFCALKRSTSDAAFMNHFPIIWKESDLLDTNSLQDALKGATTVIHTAALVSFKSSDSEQLYRVNVEGTRNVVNACLSMGIPRLIHISSVAALGRQKGVGEIDESNKWVDNKLNSEYAESKYLAELEVYRGQEEGLQIDIINPSIILSQSNWNKSSAQLFKYVWQGSPFYTEGTINYIDVRDVVTLIFTLLEKEASGNRTIANAGSLPLKEFLHQIANHFEKKPPWIRVPGSLVSAVARMESVRSRLTGKEPIVSAQSARTIREKFFYDNKKAIKELGMKFRPIEETLAWCCSYYLQNATINN